jgi:hypothetical protein
LYYVCYGDVKRGDTERQMNDRYRPIELIVSSRYCYVILFGVI